MNRTIDEQLSRLETIKTDLKEAINAAYGSNGLSTNVFADFADFIRNNLTKKSVPQFTVTFNANGGTGTLPPSITVDSNTVITIPSHNLVKDGFDNVAGWSHSPDSIVRLVEFGSQYIVFSNVTLYAAYVPMEGYKLAWIQPESGGSITAKYDGVTDIVSNVTRVPAGATVTMTYNPPTSYRNNQRRWGGEMVENSTSNPVTFIMPNSDILNISISEIEDIKQYTVNLTSSNINHGEVTGSGIYDVNTVVEIVASPKEGYKFVKWSDNNTDARRSVTVEDNLTLTALFEVQELTLNVIEFVCAVGGETPGNFAPFYEDLGYGERLELFATYNESEIEQWFDVSNLALNIRYNDNYTYLGPLRNNTYQYNDGDSVNIDNSRSMYWIALPCPHTLTSFIVDNNTTPEDRITFFTKPEEEGYKLFENVTLNDSNNYNIYGVCVDGNITDATIQFD